MRKHYLILLLVFLVCTCIYGQNTSSISDKWRLRSINQVGLLEGEGGAAFQLQTIIGVHKGSWGAGIGVGFDHYFQKAIPVFLDLRKELFEKPNSPFIYAEAGIPYTWKKDPVAQPEYRYQRLYEAGLGYQFPLGRYTKMMFSAGYSYRKYTEYVNTQYWMYNIPPPKQRFDYELRRISIRTGLIF